MAIEKPKKKRTGTVRPKPLQTPADESIGARFARITAPRELDDDEKRRKWELPTADEPEKAGPYIIELNVQHVRGLAGAEHAFKQVFQELTELGGDSGHVNQAGDAEPLVEREPVRIAKSYYRCDFKDREWRKLIALDQTKPVGERSIYRIWPDFPVTAQTDRSMMTIKADAALRSFDAAGTGITWAVIDSGIVATHPHFGSCDADSNRNRHALLADSVRYLHRCFADVGDMKDGVFRNDGPIPDPDLNPEMDREVLLKRHTEWALRDDYGHGTHVAGIIAGEAPEKLGVAALQQEYQVDSDGTKIMQKYICTGINAARYRGVAPRCKLVSLRVLDHKGKGRASQVIQALEYIRERVNDNTKLMRVHGVNLSVGYEFDAEMFACGQSPLCAQVDRLVQEGVVVVTAAGNTGYGTVAAYAGGAKVGLSNTINDPGNAALAITVGSTHRDSPHTFGVSYFSSKGPTGDGRLKPDLLAPGERITSCAAGQKLETAKKKAGISEENGVAAYYIDDSGTSMAAPHVSGAIAAFLSIRREFIGKPIDVKRIFLESATPLGRERYFEGHGLVDLMRAIQSV